MDKKLQMTIIMVITFVLAVCLKSDFVRFLLGFEILIVALAIIELFYLQEKITAKLVLPETMVYRNEHFPVKIQLSSTSKLPVPRIKAQVVVQDLWAEKEVEASGSFMMDSQESGQLFMTFDPLYCGAYAVTVTSLTYWDHLGILHKTITVNDHTRTLYVVPEILADQFMEEELGREEADGDDAFFRSGRSNVDTSDIRTYREGDLFHHIHWKLSAKLDELMIRELGEPIEKMNRVYLNLQHSEEALTRETWDAFIVTVAKLCRTMLNGGRSHYVCWIDLQVRSLLEYQVTDTISLQEMLCGLFHAKVWKAGEATDILEDIRWDEKMEENIEVDLQGQIVFAGEQR